MAGDALALARGYRERLGLSNLYVADLDAIAGGHPQSALLRALAAESTAWIDGGADSEVRAREVAATGAARVVIGLESLPALDAVAPIARALGPDRIAVSLDLRVGVPPGGFAPTPSALVGSLITVGVHRVILLDLARVGSSRGPDLELLRLLRRDYPSAELVIAGGVRGVEDLRDAAAAGAWGALVATAFHTATIRRHDLEVLAHDSHA